jgi:septal ring factor EnvC (AmiA/AmiB activator)
MKFTNFLLLLICFLLFALVLNIGDNTEYQKTIKQQLLTIEQKLSAIEQGRSSIKSDISSIKKDISLIRNYWQQ